MEQINNFITAIVQVSFDNLPIEEEWDSYKVNAYVLTKMVEINADYYIHEEEVSFNPKYQESVKREEDLTFLFMDLRKVMYETAPEKGAWYTCKIIVYPTGKFETHFDYDNKPNFTYEPSNEKYKIDFQTFPREKSMIPVWLQEKMKA